MALDGCSYEDAVASLMGVLDTIRSTKDLLELPELPFADDWRLHHIRHDVRRRVNRMAVPTSVGLSDVSMVHPQDIMMDVMDLHVYLRMEDILMSYLHLYSPGAAVDPSVRAQFEAHSKTSSNTVVLFPSPFRSPRDPIHSVAIFLEDNTWDDFTGLRPRDVSTSPLELAKAFEGNDFGAVMRLLLPLSRRIRLMDPVERELILTEVRRVFRSDFETAQRQEALDVEVQSLLLRRSRRGQA
jgi:hypothetical protein